MEHPLFTVNLGSGPTKCGRAVRASPRLLVLAEALPSVHLYFGIEEENCFSAVLTLTA